MFTKIKKNTLKATSSVLALSLVVNLSGVYAKQISDIPIAPIKNSRKLVDGSYKEFFKNSPSLTLIGTAAAGLITAGVMAFGYKMFQKIYLHDVSTAVDAMTNQEVINYRNDQIDKLEKSHLDLHDLYNLGFHCPLSKHTYKHR